MSHLLLTRRCALHRSLTCLALLAGSGIATSALAAFPEKPIRVVVATAPGTPVDVVTRMAKELGQTFIVDNKPGAAGVIGGADVAKAPADGYTVLNIFMPMTVAPSLIAKVPFDLSRDFTPVGQMVWSYNVLATHPSVPAKSVKELVALLKAQPGKMSFASGGVGTPAQLAGELFKIETKTFAVGVPYNQFGQAITDLVGGTHQFMFGATSALLPFVANGRLNALAVTSPARLPSLPEVPTLLELGYKELVIRDWQGLAVRAGTPPEVVAKLGDALAKALADPEVLQGLAVFGAVPAAGTAAQFGQLIADETKRWAAIVKRQNVKLN